MMSLSLSVLSLIVVKGNSKYKRRNKDTVRSSSSAQQGCVGVETRARKQISPVQSPYYCLHRQQRCPTRQLHLLDLSISFRTIDTIAFMLELVDEHLRRCPQVSGDQKF